MFQSAFSESLFSSAFRPVFGYRGVPTPEPDDAVLVSSNAEAITAITAAATGTVVRATAGTYNTNWNFSAITVTDVTFEAEVGTVFQKIDFTDVSGLTLKGLVFLNETDTGSDDAARNDASLSISYIIGGSLTFDNCDISAGTTLDKTRRYRGIQTVSGSTELTVTNSYFHQLHDGIVSNGVSIINVVGNHFFQIREDAITGLMSVNGYTVGVVTDNTATWFQGGTQRRFTGTVSGTWNVGDWGQVEGTQRGFKVIRVDGAYIEGQYNEHGRPEETDTVTNQDNTGVLTNITNVATGDTDGIHGDFLQFLLNFAIADCGITVERNYVYRTNPFIHTELSDESSVQVVLLQSNGNPNYWNPVAIIQNVFSGGFAIAITLERAKNVLVRGNTALTPKYSNSQNRIKVTNSTDVTLIDNVADGNGPGYGAVIDGGGNTNVTDINNLDLKKAYFEINFGDPWEYPVAMVGFAPVAGQSVDLAGAGALTTSGAWRSLVDTTDPVLISSSPADEEANVAVSADLTLVFNEPMAKGSGIVLVKRHSDDVTIQTVDVDLATITDASVVVPLADHVEGEHVYVNYATGVFTDIAGNPAPAVTGNETLDFTALNPVSTVTTTFAMEVADGITKVAASATIEPTLASFTALLNGSVSNNIQLRSGATGTGGIGPEGAHEGTNYVFVESSTSTLGAYFFGLLPSTFDASIPGGIELDYWYMKRAGDNPVLGWQYLPEGADTTTGWITFKALTGKTAAKSAPAIWLNDVINLKDDHSITAGDIRLRWYFQISTSGGVHENDLAMDLLVVSELGS